MSLHSEPFGRAAVLLACGLVLATTQQAAAAGLPDAAPWGRVLSRFQSEGGLDYAGLKAAPEDLEIFSDSLAEASLEGSSRQALLAFWVNTYNAAVARFVIDRYPELESVREEEGFFDGRRFRVAGEDLTLDEIEDRALDFGDPRVHFAVVCASTGCPDLRHEPFVAERLDEQLDEQTRAFLADPAKGLRFDPTENVLCLSSLFKWYPDDFNAESRVDASFARDGVLAWVLGSLPAEQARELEAAKPQVRYLDYDWSLNDRPRG